MRYGMRAAVCKHSLISKPNSSVDTKNSVLDVSSPFDGEGFYQQVCRMFFMNRSVTVECVASVRPYPTMIVADGRYRLFRLLRYSHLDL